MEKIPTPLVLECMHFVASSSIEHKRLVKNYEFDLYLDGNRVISIDGKSYKKTEKCLIFRKPGQFTTGIGNYNMFMVTLDFSHSVFDEQQLYRNLFGKVQPLCSFSDLDDIPPVFPPKHFDEIKELMKKLSRCSYPNVSDPAQQEQIMKELLLLILYDANNYNRTIKDPLNSVNYHVKRACDYIIGNFEQKITLDDLCEHLFLNKNYLIKLFNKELGVSPQKYVLETRLIRARHLLLQTNQSIQEIAFSCGFNTPSYFTKKFKARFGVLPMAIKQIKSDLN